MLDFGTSGKLKNGEMFNLNVGTPLYVSPEVLKNKYNEKCVNFINKKIIDYFFKNRLN